MKIKISIFVILIIFLSGNFNVSFAGNIEIKNNGKIKTDPPADGNDQDGDDNLYELSLEELMNIEVESVSRKSEKLFDAPLSATVITGREIRESGALSIVEALQLVPGVIVRQKTNGNYDVHIRGNDNVPSGNNLLYANNSISLVMIDNRPVYYYLFGGTFWESLPVGVDDVERIEVVRGPSAALYGANAVSGVINIITKKPDLSKTHVNADIQGGNTETYVSSVSVSTGINKKLGLRLSGNYEKRNRFVNDFYLLGEQKYIDYSELKLENLLTTGGELKDRFPNPELGIERKGANLTLSYAPLSKMQIDVSGGIQKSRSHTYCFEYSDIANQMTNIESYYVNVNAKTFGLNTQVAYNKEDSEILGVSGYSFKSNFFMVSSEYDFKIGDKILIRPGINYQQSIYDDDKYKDTKDAFFGNSDAKFSALAYYIRGEYNLSNKLKFIGAIRSETYNIPDDTYISYQLGASYYITPNRILRLVHSRSNRGPFLVDFQVNANQSVLKEIMGQLVKGIINIEGNKDLDLMTMDLFELGYRSKLTDNFHLDMELFYSHSKDYNIMIKQKSNPIITPQSLSFLVEYRFHNVNTDVHQYGATANLHFALAKKLQLKTFLTLQKTNLEDKMAFNKRTEVVNGVPTTIRDTVLVDEKHLATPDYYGGFNLNYMPIKKLNFNLSCYAYGKQVFENWNKNVDINSKVVFNMKVSYKFWKNCSVYFNARNLLNDKTREFAFADKTGGLYLLGLDLNF